MKQFQQNRELNKLSCGRWHTACILEDRTLWTFGYGRYGELGYGNNTEDQFVPKKVESISLRVLQISCGASHTACILEDGTLWTFGNGQFGRLGHGNNTENQFVPKKVESISLRILQVSCGASHTACILEDGTLWTFGYGEYGELGHGNNTKNQLVPKKVESISLRVLQISCGDSHTACILEDRTLWTFGYGRCGQLGHGNNTENQFVPKKVDSISLHVLQVSCGHSHTACILEDGTLWTFGYGEYGQLGHGNNTKIQLVPKKVESISLRVLQISCGYWHTACILEDGTLWTFGYGEYGELGYGNNTENQLVPKKVESISLRVLQISCGTSHTACILEDGSIWTFGYGELGELGHGNNTETQLVPKKVESILYSTRHLKIRV
jgi:alpha-tubulin suppressor-like RCC1 family protein